MIPNSLQVIHLHLFMFDMMILYPSGLSLSPSRHWRELIFVYMHMRRLARLLERSSSGTTICGRWSSG